MLDTVLTCCLYDSFGSTFARIRYQYKIVCSVVSFSNTAISIIVVIKYRVINGVFEACAKKAIYRRMI